jgi:hypothetical protein
MSHSIAARRPVGAVGRAIALPWDQDAARPFALSARTVDLLALLEWFAEIEDAAPANPALARAAAASFGAGEGVAIGLLRLLRGVWGRDTLIKSVVRVCHGTAGDQNDVAHEALVALVEELKRIDALHQPAWDDLRREQIEALRSGVDDLAAGLDPIRDFAEVTGEPCPLSVAVAPCLFLPPPQEGRHGVFLPLTPTPSAQLYFGFPLADDPVRYGIDRQFLCFGAWHYAMTGFLRSCWPPIEPALREAADVEPVFAGSLRRDRKRPWPAAVEEHLKLALRCQVAERSGGRRSHFRLLAEAFGLPHFEWFTEGIDRARASGLPLRHHIANLPEALASSVRAGELGNRSCPIPEAINLTLIAQRRDALCIVVPDDWNDSLIEKAYDCWSELSVPVVRHASWSVSPDAPTSPAIALGNPGNNPIVATVLERRAMKVPAADDAALVVALTPETEREPWYVAVAAKRAEAAASVTLEVAVRLTCSFAIVDAAGRVLASDGITGGL